jgi:hypothetical protein
VSDESVFCSSVLYKLGRWLWLTSFLAVLFELRVSLSGVTSLGLTLSGRTWQW